MVIITYTFQNDIFKLRTYVLLSSVVRDFSHVVY